METPERTITITITASAAVLVEEALRRYNNYLLDKAIEEFRGNNDQMCQAYESRSFATEDLLKLISNKIEQDTEEPNEKGWTEDMDARR